MNRRSFFTSLGLIAAAATAPGIFVPRFEPVRWKVLVPTQTIWVPNPEYVRAPYEIRTLHSLSDWKVLQWSGTLNPGFPLFNERFPLRFRDREMQEPVNPFIAQSVLA